ncbi:gamma carbonic anhydrase family protein [Tistrella mobilis]|uniref:Gamma carbonic anhydrase family protein n=1 Tax=Tistrella mobilis TaxID=171437 RepID=A0A162LYK2_9PROT|nr:gamma carbonic anhydrase family protein [Tistrella mobilis]KYO57581.1 gamma carbonic anhydrase family protein [Tistrella mobilis]
MSSTELTITPPADPVPSAELAARFPGAIILPFDGIWPKIDASCYVAPGAVVVGQVEIGPESSIWYGCVLRGDVNHIHIGRGTNLQDGTIVHVSRLAHPTLIGDDVTIGHRAMIHACTLMSGAFVGMSATVLDGAVVEGGAIVGAGALVGNDKRVAAGELWGGVPAKKLRDLGEEGMPRLAATARHYSGLAASHQEIAREVLGAAVVPVS